MPVPSKRIVYTFDAMAHVRAAHSTVVTRDGGELSLFGTFRALVRS